MSTDPDIADRRQRETFLTILLCTLVVAGGLVFMIGLMGMFVIHAITVMVAMVGFGGFHYLLWGRSLSQEMENEREELADDAPPPDGLSDGPPDDAFRAPRF